MVLASRYIFLISLLIVEAISLANHVISRRSWMIASSLATLPANAACLAGDTSPDCIGVYKVPIDDGIKSMVGTKEALDRYAPGMRFVPPPDVPKSVSNAREILETQREAARDIEQVVAQGKLEEAGIKILNLLPKVTTSGRLLVDATKDEVKSQFLQQRLDIVLALYSEADVMIGQGLRGQMGSLTVAQLNIIKQLKEASAAFDDLLVMLK